MISLSDIPNEILVIITGYLGNISLKALRLTCSTLYNVCSDNYLLDMGTLKLYPHQIRAANELLEREAKGLNTILNLDTGTGKTATVMYAYKQSPRPTVIVAAPKLIDNWLREFRKYNVNIPILTFSDTAKAFEGYERIIIDEVHQSFGGDTLKSKRFIDKIQGKILWGLSATSLGITKKGTFRSYHLQQSFNNADCVITLKLGELDAEAKQGFHLPEFFIVDLNPQIFKIDIEEGKTLHSFIIHYYKQLQTPGEILTPKIIKLMRSMYGDIYSKSTDADGNIIVAGKKYNNITARELCNLVYKEEFSTNMGLQNKAILPLAKELESGRTILFGNFHICDIDQWYSKEDRVFITPRMHSKNCEWYVSGRINRLILPSTYGVGINLGKIDTLIIAVDLDYKQFHQILGRINRLEQNNRTKVYIFSTFLYNAESDIVKYIDKYSEQFK